MNYYIVNESTCALVPVGENKTRVYELDKKFEVNLDVASIINDSCLKYGSSFVGRSAATRFAIGYTHKAPICINEKKVLIMFPTRSPRLINCSWICYNNIYIYCRAGKDSSITFRNNVTVNFDISYLTLQNQLFRASRLDYYFKNTFQKNN